MSFFLEKYDVFDLSMKLGHDYPAFPIGLQDVRIERDARRAKYGANADKITMSCHAGTHLDGPGHFCPEYMSPTIDEIPLPGRLIGEGVVVDISHRVKDYGIYTKEDILSAGVEIRKGDILIINTGYHRYQPGQPNHDELAYFYRHPGPREDFAEWCLEMEFNYLGIDAGSQDHPLNTGLQGRLPAEDAAFCATHGVNSVHDIFPRKNWQLMHSRLFGKGIIHVENVGGEIDKVLNKRCIIATMPLKLIAESAPCRMVAFVEKK